jgi:hypothetical protein
MRTAAVPRRLPLCIAAFALVSVLLPVLATPPRGVNNATDEKLEAQSSPALAAINRLALATRLEHYGYAQADVTALTIAAKIRKSIGISGDDNAQAVARLLERAEEMAAGNPVLLLLVAEARDYRVRDLPVGSNAMSTLRHPVPSLGADRIVLTFRGGEPAAVHTVGADPVNLDLYVYDEYNNLVCFDDRVDEDAQCRWRPRWTGEFLLDVQNKASLETEYVLTSNRHAENPQEP